MGILFLTFILLLPSFEYIVILCRFVANRVADLLGTLP